MSEPVNAKAPVMSRLSASKLRHPSASCLFWKLHPKTRLDSRAILPRARLRVEHPRFVLAHTSIPSRANRLDSWQIRPCAMEDS